MVLGKQGVDMQKNKIKDVYFALHKNLLQNLEPGTV